MSATDPSAPAQPATPAMDLRETVAYLVFRAAELMQDGPMRPTALQAAEDILREVRAELDAAPATYSLPAEPPPEVTELWDRGGSRWLRHRAMWVPDGASSAVGESWLTLLELAGPLSTAPPAGTEAQ